MIVIDSKVLVLSEYGFTSGGGAERYSHLLFKGLEKAGIVVTTASIKSSDAHVKLSNGCKTTDKLYDRSFISNLELMVKEHNIGIIHANILDQPQALAFTMAIRKLDRPYVTTVHSYAHICPTEYYVQLPELIPCDKPFLNRHCIRCMAAKSEITAQSSSSVALYMRIPYNMYIFRNFLQRAKVVISPSEKYANALRQLSLGCYYLPHPVEANPSKPVDAGDGSIVFVGRLEWEKGTILLPKIAKAFLNHTVHIIGIGSMYSWLKEQKIPNMILHGYISKESKEMLMSKCSVVIVPSIWCDLFNYVVSEAFTFAKPVVSFNLGGPKEQIEQSNGGLLARAFDTQDFVRKIKYLLKNENEAKEMGLNGRLWILETSNPEKYIRNLLTIYSRVLSEHSAKQMKNLT